MDVYVLEYVHKYGTDISVYSTAEKAWESAMAIVAQYRDDYEEFNGEEGDADEGILPTPAPTLEEVWDQWADVTGEYFEVNGCTVDPTGPV
jgi:hypothetical protein